MRNERYWQINYQGTTLFRVWAASRRDALKQAKAACIRFGHRGIDYNALEAV